MKKPFNTSAGSVTDAAADVLRDAEIEFSRTTDGSLLLEGSLPWGAKRKFTIREIARKLFGSENAVITLNMSEFADRHSIFRITGAPPGYVGFETGGKVASEIRARPRSLLVLDEIEKAHPDVTKVFSQMALQGSIADASGTVIDCSDLVVLKLTDVVPPEIRDRRAARQQEAKKAARTAAVEQIVMQATVLQKTMSVGRPLSYRSR